jgi:hypothetical protein
MMTTGVRGFALEIEGDGKQFSGAVFSPDQKYRYVLWREWSGHPRRLVVIGLNPSTADATKNDPTVTRCINFAKREGCGGMIMLNLFAFRATDPGVMMEAADPVGPENDKYILAHASRTIGSCSPPGASPVDTVSATPPSASCSPMPASGASATRRKAIHATRSTSAPIVSSSPSHSFANA